MRGRIKILAFVSIVSFAICVFFFWLVEHEKNPNVKTAFDAVWWWVVTSASVGYGDIVPVTKAGRVVGILTIISGFFVFANFISLVAESMHEYFERRNKGLAHIEAEHHIVICEYTAVADELIQSLPELPEFAKREVVVVSDLISRSPYPQYHFVCGVALNPMALKMASVAKADYIFVFANLRFADPDIKTLHTASRIMALNSSAKIFVEMVKPSSDMLQYMNGRVIPMDSRTLMELVLQDKHIDPNIFIAHSAKT